MLSKLGVNLHRESRVGKVAGRLKTSIIETVYQTEKHPNFSSDAFLFGDPDGRSTAERSSASICTERAEVGRLLAD